MKTDAIAVSTAPSKLADLLVLAKVRLNALVVVTTAGGYYMAAPGAIEPLALLAVCVGTALVAAGAAAINQVQERDVDRLMVRTRLRPVADGRMSRAQGAAISLGLAVSGVVLLWLGANPLAAGIAATTFLIYALAYTPLKRRSSLATIVGAIPGALPPLIGWAAARGTLEGLAPWTLFLVMFLWQLPHFLAIAWIYREDYARARLPMLPVVDRDGVLTGMQALIWAATLIPFSALPYLVGLTTATYAVGALVLGIGLLVLAARFAFARTDGNARKLFYGSITYLPLLWLVMALARR
jgi:heme o synthase